MTCESIQFEDFTKSLGKWFNISAYCPERAYFITLLEDITERKKSEKALKESKETYRRLFTNMIDGFAYCQMIFDDNGKPVDFVYLEINDAFEKLTGLKKEAVLGKKVSEAIPGTREGNPELFEIYGRVASTGNEERFEVFFKPLQIWLSISVYSPQKGYFVAVFENITDRKKAEQELRQAKNDWERTFDTIPDFIAILDNSHKIVRANRAMAEQLGVKPEQAIGLSCYKCVHGTELPPEFCPHTKTLEDGKEHVAEVHEPRLGGDFIVSTTPIRDEHGRVTGSVHVARNITERKKAEREIERLASFPTLNPNPVFEVDFNGKITYSNPATRILFPDLEELHLSHPFLSDWSNIVKNFEHKTVIFFGREIKVGDHWYHEQMYHVPQTHKIRVYTVDVDELKKTEEARVKAQIKLEENAILLEEYASQMEELAEQRAQQLKNSERLAAIGQTAGMVGHDIRNPLQAITGDIYLIKQELDTMPEGENKQAVFESIDAINENLTYIDKIISDLQDYTRPLRPSIQDANLSELIEGTILTINIPKRIELITEIHDNSKAIKTDVAYLRRILTNLITNAVQAMPNEGKLSVQANKKKDKIIICVADSGVGIPDDVKTKLFTPLFTTKSKGQGLGLAVVKRLVEALKGEITFESQPNKGTKFIVELPQT